MGKWEKPTCTLLGSLVGAALKEAAGTPALRAYASADLTGNRWDNLYFQGRLNGAEVDPFFAGLQSGVSYDQTIARMLDSGQYFTIILEPMATS